MSSAFSVGTHGNGVPTLLSPDNSLVEPTLYIFGGMDKDGKDVSHVQVYDTKDYKCTLFSTPMPHPSRLMRAGRSLSFCLDAKLASYLTLRRILGKKELSSRLVLFTLVWFLKMKESLSSVEVPTKRIRMEKLYGRAKTTWDMSLFGTFWRVNTLSGGFTGNCQDHLLYKLLQICDFQSSKQYMLHLPP